MSIKEIKQTTVGPFTVSAGLHGVAISADAHGLSYNIDENEEINGLLGAILFGLLPPHVCGLHLDRAAGEIHIIGKSDGHYRPEALAAVIENIEAMEADDAEPHPYEWFDGVNKEIAKALEDRFGLMSCADLVERHREELVEISGIGTKRAETMFNQVAEALEVE